MIRDPSDGSVREVDHQPKPLKPKAKLPESFEFITGQRQPTKTDAMERLEFSREWLKQYHAKKETAHARGSNGTEHSTDGRSSNDQGQAQSAVSSGNGADPGAHREG